jgi:hypothetical protein
VEQSCVDTASRNGGSGSLKISVEDKRLHVQLLLHGQNDRKAGIASPKPGANLSGPVLGWIGTDFCNVHFAVSFNICNICTRLHRCKLKLNYFANFRTLFRKMSANVCRQVTNLHFAKCRLNFGIFS